MIKVSVIVPVYNAEKFLGKCIDGILNQSLQEIEVVCVNDGSKDGSKEILDKYSVKDNRIKVFSQENKGAGAARNYGIREAKGEFVAFMDADDCYPDRNTLEKLYEVATQNKVLIAGGSFSSKERTFEKNDKRIFESEGMQKYSDYQFDYGFTRFIYSRRMILENNIFFPERYVFEDPVFFVTAMITADRFYAIKNSTYCVSGTHHGKLNCEGTVDFIKGLTENLKLSSYHKLGELHQLMVERLNTTCSFYAEKYLENKDVFQALLRAYAVIDFELLREIGSQYKEDYILEPLELVWKSYTKYEKIRNNFLIKILRKLKS